MYSNYIAHLIVFFQKLTKCMHSSSYSSMQAIWLGYEQLPDVWRSQGANSDPADVSQQPRVVMSFHVEDNQKKKQRS